jgi:hypothetical protein
MFVSKQLRAALLVVGALASLAITAGTAQAAGSGVSARAGHHVATAKKGPKPTEYALVEDGIYNYGHLQLYKKTHTWNIAAEGIEEFGTYTNPTKKTILLTESAEANDGSQCVFEGTKGKKNLAWSGNWYCPYPLGDERSGTWTAEKL